MSTDYTRQELIQKVLAASPDVPTFYQQDFINYTGKTKDTKEYYTEVVAEWIIENIQLLRQIPQITRSASYKTPSHDVVVINAASNRMEEQIAKEMRLLEELPLVGKILDYQTPLKNKQSDHAGKIDLLAYDGTTLRILELKEPDSKETMLRCILEGYTYLQTVNQKKLLKNFDLPENTPVIANPFVFFGGHQYCEMQEDRPMLKRLILLLNSKPLYIKQQGNRYDVVADLR